MDDHKCTVCSSKITGIYCSNCGQKKGGKPTNLIRLFLDFVEQVISIQKSDLATMLQVIKRPRFIVENYHNGNTGYYSSPGKVMLFTILILIVHMTFISNLILGVDFSAGGLNLEYTFLFMFILIFFVVSQIVFSRRGVLMSKHIIATTYIVSTFITFYMVFYWIVLLTIGEDSIFTFTCFIMSIVMWLSIVFTNKRNFLNYFFNAVFVLGLFLILVIAVSNDFTLNSAN
ncbi:MAG: hypothetical protein QNL61_03405 [Crocinitomicaceae bacterium]